MSERDFAPLPTSSPTQNYSNYASNQQQNNSNTNRRNQGITASHSSPLNPTRPPNSSTNSGSSSEEVMERGDQNYSRNQGQQQYSSRNTSGASRNSLPPVSNRKDPNKRESNVQLDPASFGKATRTMVLVLFLFYSVRS